MKFRWTSCAAALLLAAGACVQAQAASFPDHPVKMIVGYPAGAGNDLIARAVSNRLSEMWNQPVIVENRAGASGVIGAEAAARAAPDGYTLLLTGSSHLIQASLGRKLPYKPVDDFTPISRVGSGPLVLEVHPSVPARNVQELIALAKAQPGMSFGSAGNGTSPHIAGEMFKRMAGVDMSHIPYKGSAPAQSDLIGGQIQTMFQVTQAALPSIKAGQVRAIAVSSKERLADLPDVPTIAESGLPGYDMLIWWGVLAPAGVPKDLVRTLNEAVQKVVADPKVQKQLAAAGLVPGSSTSEELGRIMRSDYERYTKLVREAGIKDNE